MVTAGCAASQAPPATVRPGIDVLLSDSLHLIAGRKIGLLTNQTGVDQRGAGDLERLLRAGAQVTAIFSPEHGYRGVLDEELVEHGLDSATQLRIWSLYGNVRAPTAEMLKDVDVLVIDLQDIGARTYTYISTALLTMREARAAGVRVILLDRPNPIGGLQVQGPVLDTAFSSFIGMLPVPLRHGMTMGELARFGNDALEIRADLSVVPAAGWTRDLWFDRTNLLWVRPSPNMPNLESATHYPGTVLFEATNLSVGRGTPIAFQGVGAPWLSPRAITERMAPVGGLSVSDTTVTPDNPPDQKYGGVSIPFLRFTVADRGEYDPVKAAVALLVALREAHGDSLSITPARFDQLAGSSALRQAIEAGHSAERIWTSWTPDLDEFRRVREGYLWYR